MNNVKHLYIDGGVIWSNNPKGSNIGGTWGIVGTDENDEFVFEDSGFVKMTDRLTTNNHTEFVAAIYALEKMPLGWSGTLGSDSKITLGRLFSGDNTKNLPQELIQRATMALERLGVITPIHYDGHPTKAQLETGIGKRGNPVSKWQKRCDDLCNLAKEPYAMKDGKYKDTSTSIPSR